MEFLNQWAWLIFVIVGLLMVLMELILGIETSLDMVILGSALIGGGLITWLLYSFPLTLIVTSLICVAYVALGRRYVHRWVATKKAMTNVDALIGKTAVVLANIEPNHFGLVKVGGEEWRARADEEILAGEVVKVTGLQGVTLNVKKSQGG